MENISGKRSREAHEQGESGAGANGKMSSFRQEDIAAREEDNVSGSDSDDDFGPMPSEAVELEDEKSAHGNGVAQKKRRIERHLKFEKMYLKQLPSAEFYEHSYMHRDQVTHICVSKECEFVITGSRDGHVKFWKKMPKSIEFVKHYHAHLGPIHAMVISYDQKMLVTTSADRMVKFFEISGFDMSNMIAVEYIPNCATWLNGVHKICDRVAVSDTNSGDIFVYKIDNSLALHKIQLHSFPVK